MLVTICSKPTYFIEGSWKRGIKAHISITIGIDAPTSAMVTTSQQATAASRSSEEATGINVPGRTRSGRGSPWRGSRSNEWPLLEWSHRCSTGAVTMWSQLMWRGWSRETVSSVGKHRGRNPKPIFRLEFALRAEATRSGDGRYVVTEAWFWIW